MSREDWPTAGKSLRALTGFIHLRINPPHPPLRKGEAGDLKGGERRKFPLCHSERPLGAKNLIRSIILNEVKDLVSSFAMLRTCFVALLLRMTDYRKRKEAMMMRKILCGIIVLAFIGFIGAIQSPAAEKEVTYLSLADYTAAIAGLNVPADMGCEDYIKD